ncbi:MAG: tRNA (N(6)-L-threonylcarbamoyladenosine(37)-C(2))-methylthiotransferase MtaB, partial [Candidatus Omnitrophica bacterium]|nr:tRNA (N(6)-L-threonylcarbamoyladenosine(37)-C(2))-methylthiotransferase MtaB [Candidatus Omnitrophota bacterium]
MTALKIKFVTLGCKVNQYETQALKEQCTARGLIETKGIADIYIINTCTVTGRADAKSREAIARAKRCNPKAKIVVCGCMTQLGGEKNKKLEVDYIVPQEKKHLLIDIITPSADRTAAESNLSADQKTIWSLHIHDFENKRAFVKVQ